ncbi:MAG: S24/S26 family peptidase [Myxococcota bacterium]|nr:S24/S26 family peptidase [Myxococcota bacterium]
MNVDALIDHYVDLICEQLVHGQTVIITARGQSMWPFIQDDDRVQIAPRPARIKLGDVVCVKRGETLILHRVTRVASEHAITTWGDALPASDGWSPMTAVYGIVQRVWRRGRPIPMFRGTSVMVAARILGQGRRQFKRFERSRLGIQRLLSHHGRHE